MKTFKGKDYDKERDGFLATLKDLRTKRDECKDQIAFKTGQLEEDLSELQRIRADVIVDVEDIGTIEDNIRIAEDRISELKVIIEESDSKIGKAVQVISGAEQALDQPVSYTHLTLPTTPYV